MLGLEFDDAMNIALAGAAVFSVAAVASLWIIKSVVQKAIVAVLLALLAFATWSQRTALQDCADKVEELVVTEVEDVTTGVTGEDTTQSGDTGSGVETTCAFFGVEVTIPFPVT